MAELKEMLLEKMRQSQALSQLAESVKSSRKVNVDCASLPLTAFLVSEFAKREERSCVCVLENNDEAKFFYDDLSAFGIENALFYPALGAELWRELGPPHAQIGRRIASLSGLLRGDYSCLVIAAEALLEKVADPEMVELYKLSLKVGEEIPFGDFIRQLVEMGYVREQRVDAPGEMCVRGGIVDIFLFERESPYRIEFFGDTIESIRYFDVETQRSIESCDYLEILPLSCAGPYSPMDEITEMDLRWEKTILDYIAPDCIVWQINEPMVQGRLEGFQREAAIRFDSEDFSAQHPYGDFYTGIAAVEKKLQNFKLCVTGAFSLTTPETALKVAVEENIHFGGDLKLFQQHIKNLKQKDSNTQVAIACDSEKQAERLKELFLQEAFPQSIHILTLPISNGFFWLDEKICIYTNRELYSRVRLVRADKLDRQTVSFREQLAIQKGDYVVHEDYGIGIFRDVEKITAYGKKVECLKVEYEDGDLLFVPLEKMDKIQKYASSDSAAPALSRLGSPNWEKLKKRTKKRMKEIAKDLIKLYATRKSRPGFSFSDDTIWQKELEASFPFEETADQLSAIQDVKKDMQAPRPMDRLICGDVGYGKTEVAIRAAFKAINEGKQVALLVPTTILAQQHFDTFSQRLAHFPVKVELLSRFRTPAQQKELLEQTAMGQVDLLVGTHRLLSKDVKFKDLGLLIVDEEQRFGVMHKEKLKLLKQTVDTLTLSATPIPRTMHMALMGAKDMSIINSPPHNRVPVKTLVTRFDEELIREAILNEIDRNGQVFFVHNRVQSIYGIAALLNKIVPEVKTVVAHGQMRGHELEKAMLKFVRGEAHVLVSTMIIENGIDLPRANTLIINRADKLGLAQLYQLRGRVGRSDRQAYAYLLIPPVRKLGRDAIKRLQTIQEYSELGAGYKIAMRDLEIRGAGNIFGAEQTGFVNALGYELYSKIIQQSIEEIKKEFNIAEETMQDEQEIETTIHCKLDTYLPESYIASATERVDIYRRLIKARNEKSIDAIYEELQDRFGDLPEEAENLLNYVRVKLLAAKANILQLKIKAGSLSGSFDFQALPQGEDFKRWLAHVVGHAPDDFELQPQKTELNFQMNFNRGENGLLVSKKFLQNIV